MSRNKNKPKKNTAAVSPAEIPAGETEVIVEKTVVADSAGIGANVTPVVNAEIDAPAPVASFTSDTPLPTFTQIGMAGMIGMLGSVAASVVSVSATETIVEPVAAVAAVAALEPEPVVAPVPVPEPEPVAATVTKESEPKIESTKEPVSDSNNESVTESVRPATATAESTGFYGYIRSFFKSLGGAVHR